MIKKTLRCCVLSTLLLVSTLPNIGLAMHAYGNLTMGTSLAETGSSMSFSVSPLTKRYTRYNKLSAALLVGLGGGVTFREASKINVDIGLGLYQANGYNAKGAIITTIKPITAHQQDYSYDVNSYRLMLEAKLKFHVKKYMPYLSAGIGPSWNTTSDYSEVVVAPGAVANDAFGGKTVTKFAYQLGIGISRSLNNKTILAVGYEYANLGEANLVSKFAGNDLVVQAMHANDIKFVVTHVFGK